MDGAAHAGIHIAVDTPRRRVYKLEAPDEASRSEWLRSLLAASKATASSPQEDAKGLLGWFGKLFGGSQEKAAMANGEAAPQEAEAEEVEGEEGERERLEREVAQIDLDPRRARSILS